MNATSRIVTDYLQRWGGLPSGTLAKKIYAEHPDKFSNVEHIRTTIRNYRGTKGEETRQGMKNRQFYGQCTIPESYAPDYTPYYLACDNTLVLSDLHIPFHDPEAIEQAIRWGKDHQVNCVLLNGDQVDCYQLSRFIKDSRYPTIRQELDSAAEFLNYIRQELPGVKIIWKNGNHEERLEAWMKIKNPELLDVLHWHFSDLLPGYDVDFVSDKRVIYTGKLPILHGHEFANRGTGQVNPARTLFLKTNHSAMVGHHHITSEHTEKRMNGEVITCWSVGALCNLTPEYSRINKWNNGFARVRTFPDGTFRVTNIRIIDGKIF